MRKTGTPLEEAKRYAFLLLKFRLRSVKELTQRLQRKNFDQTVINQIVKFLEDKHFLDDMVFAKAWIDSRLKKPFGPIRIRKELKEKGIDVKIVDEFLPLTKDSVLEMSVIELAQLRFNKLKNIETKKAKIRVFGYLVRRGFSPDSCIEAINQLKK